MWAYNEIRYREASNARFKAEKESIAEPLKRRSVPGNDPARSSAHESGLITFLFCLQGHWQRAHEAIYCHFEAVERGLGGRGAGGSVVG